MNKRAVFLDRDGTLIVDRGYIRRPDLVEILPGVIEGLLLLREKGYEFFIISNQSGIGRGLITVQEADAVNDYLQCFLNSHNITLTGIYYCPHSPDDGCTCRKPRPGLLLRAIQEHGIDGPKSFFVGDKWTDVETARAVGVRPVLLSENAVRDSPSLMVVDSLLTMARHLDEVGIL